MKSLRRHQFLIILIASRETKRNTFFQLNEASGGRKNPLQQKKNLKI